MLKLANLKKKQEELKEKDRGIVDTAIAVAQKDAQEKLQALIDADIEVKKEFAASDETTNVEYSKEDTKEEYTHYGALAVFGGITAIGKVPWGLDDMQLVSTPMAGSAKAIGNLAACFFSLANLQSLYKENTISDARLAEETLSTVATIGETAVDIWQNVEFVATGAEEVAQFSTGLVAASGVGIVFTVLGVAVSVVAGVVDGIMDKRSNNAFFDKFINMDSIEKQVRPELEKRGQVINDDKAFREQLRKRVATTLGFADVPTACDQLATVSAKQLYGKLFEENLPEDELKPYIETVKALGLKYRAGDESNRKPDLLTLKKAISGR